MNRESQNRHTPRPERERTTRYPIFRRAYLMSIVAHVLFIILALRYIIPPAKPPPPEIRVKLAGTSLIDSKQASDRMQVTFDKLAKIEADKKAAEEDLKEIKEALGEHGEELVEQFALDLAIGGDADPGFDYGLSFSRAQELVELGKDAVEPLLNALDNLEDDFKTRRRAAKTLAMIGDERAIPTLVERFITAEGEKAWWGIMLAMNKMGTDDPENGKIIGDELLRAAADKETSAQMSKNWLFISDSIVGGRDKWEDQLQRFLLDGGKAEKEGVFYTLHDSGPVNKKTQRTLAKVMLEDEDEDIRAGAATGIAYSGREIKVIHDLKTSFKKDESAKVRAAALGAINSSNAQDKIDINDQATHDVASSIRAQGATGLQGYHGNHALTTDERYQAIRALRPLLNDPDIKVQLKAINSLGDNKAREAMFEVVRFVHSDNIKLREAALYSLQRITNAVTPDEATLDILRDLSLKRNVRALQIYVKFATRDDAIEVLADVVEEPTLAIRTWAMTHLVTLRATEMAPQIARQISHPYFFLRAQSIWAIQRLGQRQYLPMILPYLNDEEMMGQKGVSGHTWTEGSTPPKYIPPHERYPYCPSPRSSVIQAIRHLGATEAIPDLIRLVETHDNPKFRIEIATVLREWVHLDRRIVPLLARLSEDIHPKSQIMVIDWLGDIGDKRAIKYLRRRLKGKYKTAKEASPFAIEAMDDRTVWSATVKALVKLGDKKIVRHLKKKLKDADEAQTAEIVDALRKLTGEKGDELARKTYRDQLGSENDEVAASAAMALRAMNDKESLPHLIELVERLPNGKPRLNVCKVLVAFGHNEGITAILSGMIVDRDCNEFARINTVDWVPAINAIECIPAMNEVVKDEGHFHMRYRTAWALGNLRHPDGLPGMTHKNVLKGPSAYGLPKVLRDLGRFKDKRAVAALTSFLEDKNEGAGLRAVAAESLGRIGDADASPVLIEQLMDQTLVGNEAAIRVKIARALAKIGSDDAVEPLTAAAREDPEPVIRQAAMKALITMEAAEAQEVIIAALKDEAGDVRAAAAAMLGRHSGIDYRHLISAARKYPANDDAVQNIRRLLAAVDAAASRVDTLRLSISEQPDNLDAYKSLIALYRELSMNGKAASIYQAYRQAAGDAADTTLLTGSELEPGDYMGDDRSWWLIGPFAYDGFDTAYPPQFRVSRDDEYIGKQGQPMTWKAIDLHSRGGGEISCNLGNHIGANIGESVCFAYRNILSKKERRVNLLFGSDDGIRIWLNDKEIFKRDIHRGMKRDQEKVTATFRKGVNRLLVRVNNGVGPAGFILRFTDQKNRPLLINRDGRLK